VRLDRAVASLSWSDWFPQVRARHLVSASSDHCPVVLDLAQENRDLSRKRITRYEVMWEREKSLTQEVRDAWMQGSEVMNMGDVACKLSKVMVA
jgi:hypothetical protein